MDDIIVDRAIVHDPSRFATPPQPAGRGGGPFEAQFGSCP